MIRILLFALCLLCAGAIESSTGQMPFAAAWADDDDDRGWNDDDDDDHGRRIIRSDDDDDDDDGGVTPVARPDRAPDEIVVSNLNDGDLQTLLDAGFVLLQQAGAGPTVYRLRIPAGLTLQAARAEVQALPSGQNADFNHYYRGVQSACNDPHCVQLRQIAFPEDAACAAPGVSIGVIDTGINQDHETFFGRDLTVIRVSNEAMEPSRAIHGTAVVALLIGAPEGRAPGLLPDSPVVAVDAFHRDGGDERADAFSLAAALDLLRSRDIRIVNMSLAGPDNTVLGDAVARIAAAGALVIASVGNSGPRLGPAYPAAYPSVVAVTAVDARGRIFRRAGRGEHVDIAAPGVSVWTAASISGARWKTGTSFATPFVTAAAAILTAQQPGIESSRLSRMLLENTQDLGDPGPDPVYGHGLLRMDGICGAASTSVPG